ncbi:hypothetical protein BCL79_1876 [Stenotrophomonas rhizophila]|uniref:Uncharacterized protein n=1 Tax=Stenotrophomonas rhizophila TaxID=216778 RepID=A0A498CLI6_9GAMM|nr:hypothetical protein [Stenotrophomonas rhizophila]RLK57470.1 hypothetical protein BCL79_1876 [Stenotrophomonas rhizophila]
MSRQYRDNRLALDTSLSVLEDAAMGAFNAGWDAYPPGALCVVRSQRYGHAPVEREALIVGTTVDLHVTCNGKPWASVSVRTKNLKTGKYRVFYPSVEVAGMPSIRVEGGDS